MKNTIKVLFVFLILIFQPHQSGSETIPIIKQRSSYTIFCFAEKPKDNIMVFDAHYLSQSIRQKYNTDATSRQHIETSTGKKIKDVRQEQDILDQAGRLRTFLFLYCRAYESKNLDKFSAFFAPDATENNRPFHEFLPRYRRNFQMIASFKYRIDLVSYSLATDAGNIRVKGKYFIQYLLNSGIWKENNGIISMELIKSGDSYLVKRLNYTFLSLE